MGRTSPPSPGLNPCFNGIWSASEDFPSAVKCESVLILVLMEYGLREEDVYITDIWSITVLILVLMEYGLRAYHYTLPKFPIRKS